MNLHDNQREWRPLDFHVAAEHWERRHAWGRTLRTKVPRESHATWVAPKDRPDPVELIERTNVGRQPELVPLRMGRMAASPFGFLRGAGAVMAWDLAHTPSSGIDVVIDGDAHLGNFGLYGTVQRDVVFDLNDFDEVTIGPWEWDLKRLAASVNVAGRENGLQRAERLAAVMRCVERYRFNVRKLERIGALEIWYRHAFPGREGPLEKIDPKAEAVLRKTITRAAQQTNANLLQRVGERAVDGAWRLREDPPILTHVDAATREKVTLALNDYADSLTRDWRYLISHYHVVDVGHRVVGVGSVGTRAYLVLLIGNNDADIVFLQVKEATAPVHEPYLPPLPAELQHQGWRVVFGQLMIQASSDSLLGWTEIDGRPFYVRQMRNMKGSVPIEWLSGPAFDFYAGACGELLGRAHARTGDQAAIAGYLGGADIFDKAIARWAESYGEQTVKDHARLVKAVESGHVKAILGV